ncbi:MAG: integrin alpha, partial [Solirubrobacterales bacterium]
MRSVDSPAPTAGDAFGQRLLAPGDLDGDHVGDLVIASPGAASGEGEVVAVSGADGTLVWNGVLRPVDAASDAPDTPTRLGTALGLFTDVAGCNQTPGDNCFALPPDGVPELLVAAPGADLNNVSAKEIGRVYVVDGRTGAIVKRIQLDPAGGLPPGGKVEFGASVLTVADFDGGGRPDIVVGAPGWDDDFGSNPGCEVGEAAELGTCEQSGRVFLFSGEDVTGTPASPVQAFKAEIPNPFAQDDTSVPAGTEPERFGAALVDIGDVGTDGQRDYLVTAPGFDRDTDVRDSGAAFMIDGATAQITGKMDPPAPQADGRFGEISYHPPRIGDVGGSGIPDVYVAAPAHTADVPAQGRAYLLSGDVFAPALLATLNDPVPVSGGGFGSAASGLASGGIVVGAPFGARKGAVHIFDANGTLAQTICDPDGRSGAGFGASIATLGDMNGDSFDDLAIGAPGFDQPGRVYILTSEGPAAAGATAVCPT